MSGKNTMKKERPCALLFGDSITQRGEIYQPPVTGIVDGHEKTETTSIAPGWISLLRNRYSRRFDLINRGYSGYNSRWAICIADRVFTADEYVFVTIFFGANDAASGKRNPKQAVPVEEYKSNVRDLVAHAKRKTKHVIVIAPPPVDSKRWPDRSNDRVQMFVRAAMEVAKDAGCDFINLYDVMKNRSPRFLSDGLHLNGEGQMLLARMILECVDRRVAKREDDSGSSGPAYSFEAATDRESNVAIDFPLWREVSNDEPTASLTPHYASSLPYRCTGR